MLTEIYQRDNKIFEYLVKSFKQKSYSELVTMSTRAQLDVSTVSEHTTIEFSKNFLEIDGALYIVLTQFLWLSENNNPSLIEGMNSVLMPLPHPNPELYYSGHCQMDFFYVLPDDFMTDDIFVRNERAEDKVIEKANWFNTTGLTLNEERALPRFMRYEYGDLLVDEDGLKAKDLTHIGQFNLTKKLFNKLELETSFQPKTIYVWYYKNNHYAYAYRNKLGVLEYELGNNFPIEDFIKHPTPSTQPCSNSA